jgi:hypothetical protein
MSKTVTEEDLELLESYLDDELAPAQSEKLRSRLQQNAELMKSLEELKSERQMRSRVWAAIEPHQGDLDRFHKSVHTAVTRETIRGTVWSARLRSLRLVSAAAAVLLFGIAGGWLLRDRAVGDVNNSLVQSDSSLTPVVNGGGTPGGGMPIRPYAYQVNLTDSQGHLVGVQQFKSFDEARAFTEDVNRWQSKQRNSGGAAQVLKAEF